MGQKESELMKPVELGQAMKKLVDHFENFDLYPNSHQKFCVYIGMAWFMYWTYLSG